MDNKKLGNNPFLFLNSHRNNYFKKLKKNFSNKDDNYQGYILEENFFSDQNIDIIQKQIVMSIFNKSNKNLGHSKLI